MSTTQPASAKGVSRSALLAIVGGLIGLLLIYGGRKYLNSDRSFRGSEPPDFPGNGAWINADELPHLANLRGKVVLIQFSFIGCGYCRMMDPYLEKWHHQFAAEGLVIIEIDNGKIDTLDDVRQWATDANIPYPVYYDTAGTMVGAYGVRGFPTRFLVGRDGKVAFQDRGWPGEEGIATLENEIRQALARQ